MSHTEADPSLESLLEYLKRGRGFDFTGYKRSSLARRIDKRMKEVGIADYGAYRDHLELHADEFGRLFDTILINVTSFFRDPDAWEVLTGELLPQLLARREGDEPVRVWSAGCASGEETYTLVMVLAEALGIDGFRERVKVYATDVDDEALSRARQAVYPAKALEDVPEELRERYFEPLPGDRYVFRGDLRRNVIFGRHDLVHDAPISHLDLLVCRNALMYFNAEVQARILARFHFALRGDGLLFLGKAEMMRSHGSMFAPVNLKARIFSRQPRLNARERLLLLARRAGTARGRAGPAADPRLLEAAVDAQTAAQVVMSRDGALALANRPARALFGLGEEDVGRPLQDLRLSYQPVELRSRVDQASAERRTLHLNGVPHPAADGSPRVFDVQVSPLADGGGEILGVSVSFVDVTRYHHLQTELQDANQALETAYEELQSTNEELETTNEELQSTIEELETTNEELQSTNEELETMNEELQSTNEELETLNDELHRRTAELNGANAYVGSILGSLRMAVAVLDRASDVRIWNWQAEELWGLRADEVEGQAFQNLDIGLPVERLKGSIRACIEERSAAEELVLDAVNRRGRSIRCRITCAPLTTPEREVLGAVVLMEEWRDGAAEQA
ncbi:MAG TPA: CheR family methyltransferase [Longimicrobiaceae bacterium]